MLLRVQLDGEVLLWKDRAVEMETIAIVSMMLQRAPASPTPQMCAACKCCLHSRLPVVCSCQLLLALFWGSALSFSGFLGVREQAGAWNRQQKAAQRDRSSPEPAWFGPSREGEGCSRP
ncbi:unnamed protein product [Eretmochelys imbricata]